MRTANTLLGWLPHRLAAALGLMMAIAVSGSDAAAQCLDPPGDITGDGKTNVLDVQCGIYVSLFQLGAPGYPALPPCLAGPPAGADIDCSGAAQISDLLLIIRHAVGLPLDPAMDADGDSCADACEVPAGFEGIPAIAVGTSVGTKLRLTAVGSGFQATGKSSSATFKLAPQTIEMGGN